MNNNINYKINKIKETYHNAPDIVFRYFKIKNKDLVIVFNQSLTSSDFINKFILRNITSLQKNFNSKNIYNHLISYIPGNNIKVIKTLEEIYDLIGNGFTIILTNEEEIIAVETKATLSRGVGEPLTEQTINGPKDAFDENYMTTIGLIRKRIKSTDLVLKEKIIGKETKNRVGIFYMDNIIEKELLEEVENKLDSIDIDGILDVTYIRDYIDTKNSIFPVYETTERPDQACMALLDGKIVIITENSPNALVIPSFFKDFFHTPEDNYQKSKNVSVTRIIRIIAFLIAILLPAFYIAITTYNHETIPITLLVNFAAQRDGVPFPAFVEGILMILIFEVLRESDIRIPSLSGNAISILGAIVLGDAAVTAGLVSPIMLIIIAVSAICGLVFSHITVVNAIRIWRFIFMLFATFLGIPGVIFSSFIFIVTLCDIKSFGKPYLYPFAPFNKNMITNSIIKRNVKNVNKRNPLLTDKNYTRSKKI